MKTVITFLFLFIFVLLNCYAQDKTIVSNSYFTTGLKQIKESANFGLVFNGANLNYGHYWSSGKNNKILSIENEIGVCIPFSKGIPALNFYLKPAEISYLFKNKHSENVFSAGPMVKFEYDYTYYPQLQSGFDYWFTNFSLGLNLTYNFQIAHQSLKAGLKTTFCGLTSRQADYRNPYFYDIGFKYAILHMNSDFEFSALNKYNSTDFELSWKPKPVSRMTLSYNFKYSGYFEAPAISIINHNIKLVITKKNKIS